MPSHRADRAAGRAPTASTTSRCSATTSRSCRPSRRSSTRPDLKLDGFIGPGHVSHGDRHARPIEFIAQPLPPADRHRRLRAARRAAGDLDGAAPARRGPRARSRTSTRASCPRRQRRGAARDRAGVRAARVLRVARPGFDRSLRACACASASRASTPSAGSPCRTPKIADPKSVPVRRGAEGRHQAAAVQGVRHRLHARDAARRADGVERRCVCGVLPVSARRERGGVKLAPLAPIGSARPRGQYAGERRSRSRTAAAARRCAN